MFDAGIYVLVSGTLRSKSNPAKTIHGEDLPLIYVDIPGRVVVPDHEYEVAAGPAKFLNIGPAAIEALPDPVLDSTHHRREAAALTALFLRRVHLLQLRG